MAHKKFRKYPKKPKQSAPLSTWQRYDDRCKEVDKYNKEILAGEKKKQAIIKKHQSTGRTTHLRVA